MNVTLRIVPMGTVERGLLEAAALGATTAYELETSVEPGLAEPKYAFNPGRNQYNASSIVRKLGQNHRPTASDLVLAIGEIDLFDPDVDFVYGDGDGLLRAAVMGLDRIRVADDERLTKRVMALAVWAVGLALGLRDCEDARCSMAAPRIPDELERRNGVLCAQCRALLAKGGQL
ncbi:MAG TPA: archaemetzincin [Vulgatibacter sp.]|nr:archaemetzincin [Vulgatibacter sp.]